MAQAYALNIYQQLKYSSDFGDGYLISWLTRAKHCSQKHKPTELSPLLIKGLGSAPHDPELRALPWTPFGPGAQVVPVWERENCQAAPLTCMAPHIPWPHLHLRVYVASIK